MDAVVLRFVYSAVLLGLCAVLLREVWTVWADPQVYVGQFEVVSESDDSTETSESFAKRIVSAQAVIGRQIAEYQSRGSADAPTDATYLLGGSDSLELPPEALAGIDITIQSVNLREVLTAVRKGFRVPNEVHGSVTVREGSVLAAVDWEHGPLISGSREDSRHFLTPNKPTPHEAAAYIACAITWARSAKLSPQVAGFSRAQVCDFAAALSDLYALGHKASQPEGLSEEETAMVRRRIAELRMHYGAPHVFAEIYRLRADLLDLLPEKLRTDAELVDAQEDRLRYAMLNPRLRDLPEAKRRFIALALARPAVILENDTPHGPPSNWAPILSRSEEVIRAASMATGLIVRTGDMQPVGTGFIVAPGLLATTEFVINGAELNARDGNRPRICFGPAVAQCGSSLMLGKTLWRDDKSHVALVDLPDHDSLQRPPLRLSTPLPEANALTGRYAFVVGYPFDEPPIPRPFLEELLGGKPGVKRVMPGRILAFGKARTAMQTSATDLDTFTTDISTASGTAGSPLIDLLTGSVLGVHYAGLWQGEQGKFAYARPLPQHALDLIAQRLGGSAGALPPKDAGSTKPAGK